MFIHLFIWDEFKICVLMPLYNVCALRSSPHKARVKGMRLDVVLTTSINTLLNNTLTQRWQRLLSSTTNYFNFYEWNNLLFFGRPGAIWSTDRCRCAARGLGTTVLDVTIKYLINLLIAFWYCLRHSSSSYKLLCSQEKNIILHRQSDTAMCCHMFRDPAGFLHTCQFRRKDHHGNNHPQLSQHLPSSCCWNKSAHFTGYAPHRKISFVHNGVGDLLHHRDGFCFEYPLSFAINARYVSMDKGTILKCPSEVAPHEAG